MCSLAEFNEHCAFNLSTCCMCVCAAARCALLRGARAHDRMHYSFAQGFDFVAFAVISYLDDDAVEIMKT